MVATLPHACTEVFGRTSVGPECFEILARRHSAPVMLCTRLPDCLCYSDCLFGAAIRIVCNSTHQFWCLLQVDPALAFPGDFRQKLKFPQGFRSQRLGKPGFRKASEARD